MGQSAIVINLEAEAKAASRNGDHATADALREQARRLRQDFLALGVFVGNSAGGRGGHATSTIDADQIAQRWSILEPHRVHTTDGAVVLDSGLRGSAIICDAGILLSGNLQNDPVAVLLLAQQAQEQWRGAVTPFGSPHFVFNYAIANEMVGGKPEHAPIPAVQRREAELFKTIWQPALDKVRAAGPTRSGRLRASDDARLPTIAGPSPVA